MLTYATPDDLTEWSGKTAPPNAAWLLRSASILVSRATLTDRYATDSTGLAADEAIRNAMRDATCAQVTSWMAVDIDPTAGAVQLPASPVSAKGIGPGSISYDTSASASVTAMTARADAATRLITEALLILANAGLASSAVATSR